MRYTFTGKNMSVYDDFKRKTENKLDRLSKLLSDDTEVFVSVSKQRHQFKMEVSVPLHKRLLRAETVGNDLETCLDAVANILEKQIVKYKGRLREKKRRTADAVTAEEVQFLGAESAMAEEKFGEMVIHRTKRFALKPMDVGSRHGDGAFGA